MSFFEKLFHWWYQLWGISAWRIEAKNWQLGDDDREPTEREGERDRETERERFRFCLITCLNPWNAILSALHTRTIKQKLVRSVWSVFLVENKWWTTTEFWVRTSCATERISFLSFGTRNKVQRQAGLWIISYDATTSVWRRCSSRYYFSFFLVLLKIFTN